MGLTWHLGRRAGLDEGDAPYNALGARLTWKQDIRLSVEALSSAFLAWCSSLLLSFALSEPCPSPPGVWVQTEILLGQLNISF